MKISVNGKIRELSVNFKSVVFSHESVIELAGLNVNTGVFTVTYSEGSNNGTLDPLQKVEFRNNLHPIFVVKQN